jgi:hypothetical protein
MMRTSLTRNSGTSGDTSTIICPYTASLVLFTTASNLMGHENITTTTIYTQPTEADLEEAVAKL